MGKHDEGRRDEAEQQFGAGLPGDRALDNAERDHRIVEAVTRGHTILEIAQAFNLSGRQVSRILADAARLVRANTADIVAQKFHIQLERLERLYRLVEMELQAYEEYMLAVRAARGANPESVTPVRFDDRPFRVAVMVCERQAKLLGMDRGGVGERDKSPVNWLNDAPIDQVIDYARQLKMTIPTTFDTDVTEPPTRG